MPNLAFFVNLLATFFVLVLSAASLEPLVASTFNESSTPIRLPKSEKDCLKTIVTTPSIKPGWREDFVFPVALCTHVVDGKAWRNCPEDDDERFDLIIEGAGDPIRITISTWNWQKPLPISWCMVFDPCRNEQLLDVNMTNISLRGEIEVHYSALRKGINQTYYDTKLAASIQGTVVPVASSGPPQQSINKVIENLSIAPFGFVCSSDNSCSVHSDVYFVESCSLRFPAESNQRWTPTLISFYPHHGWEASETHSSSFAVNITRDDCIQGNSGYDSGLADKMVRLSAIAYDTTDPQRCAAQLLGSELHVSLNVTRGDFAGYVGYSTSDRAIVVAFRGSKDLGQVWDIAKSLKTIVDFRGMGQVHQYYRNALEMLWPLMRPEVERLLGCCRGCDIWVAGHSLGGAIASLASASIVLDLAPASQVTSYSFGMPRVGTYSYACSYNKLVAHRWRVTNEGDPIPGVPKSVGPPEDPSLHHGSQYHYYKNGTHQECSGYPYGNDPACDPKSPESSHKDARGNIVLPSHTRYLGIPVGTHCDNIRGRDSGRTNLDFSTNEEHGKKMLSHELWYFEECARGTTTASPPNTSNMKSQDTFSIAATLSFATLALFVR